MSSRFTPRRTLQATPAVCISTNPPGRRPPNFPARFQLPDQLTLVASTPGQPGTPIPFPFYAITLRRVTPGVDVWHGDPPSLPYDWFWSFGLNSITGAIELAMHDATISLDIAKWPGYVYDEPWPQFQTPTLQLYGTVFVLDPPWTASVGL